MNKEPGGESLRAPPCVCTRARSKGINGAHVLVGLRENPDVGIYVRHVSVNRDGTMWNAPGSASARLPGSHGLPGDLLCVLVEHRQPPRDPTFDSSYGGLIPLRVEGQARVMRKRRFISGSFGSRSEVTMGGTLHPRTPPRHWRCRGDRVIRGRTLRRGGRSASERRRICLSNEGSAAVRR